MKTENVIFTGLKGIQVLNGKLVSKNGYEFSEAVLYDIVRAVNCHEELVNAVRELINLAPLGTVKMEIKQLLAKAEGKE